MQLAFRLVFCVLATTAASGGCGQSVTIESERAKLQGTWEVVSWELRGIKGPAEVGNQYEFAGDNFRIISGRDEVSPWITYGLDIHASPKVMQWSVKTTMPDKSVKDETGNCIYRIDGDQLELCFVTVPAPTDRLPHAFTSKPNNRLLTLKRIPFASPDEERTRNEAARARARDAAYVNLQSVIAGEDENGKYYIDFHDLPDIHYIGNRWWQALLDLRDIRNLCFRGCTGVGDEQMRHFGELISVEILDLHSTDLGDAGVSQLSGLTHLEQLDLSFTAVTDAALATISELKKLKKLALNGSLVTERGIEELRTKRSDLNVVWRRPYNESQQKAALALSQLGFRIDDDFDPYVKPKTVTCQIVFSSRKIVAPSVVAEEAKKRWPPYGDAKSVDQSVVADLLGKLPAPTAVTVRPEATDDTIVVCLRNIQGLVRLDVPSSQITDTGLAELQHHQTLKVLDLDHARRITDTGVASLASLANLEVLNLQGIESTPEALAKLLTLDHLRELQITRRQSNRDLDTQFRRKGVKVMYR